MNHETDTPRTDACAENTKRISDERQWPYEILCFARELERELNEANAEVERLTNALISCLHITNTYDGNYTRACDNVATIVTNALKTQDDT